MKKTPNYNLNKPEQTDVVNIEDLNANFDIIDLELNKKVNASDIPSYSKATISADGLMSKEDKSKLDGVATNANNYVHPNDVNTRHVSDSEKANWNGKANSSHTHPASQITAGALPVGVTATGASTDYTAYRLRNIAASTADLTPNSSALSNGYIYIVYE